MIKLGIVHGDINGVSYELILKAFEDERMVELCTPVIYGSTKMAAYHRRVLDLAPFSYNQINSPKDSQADKVNIINSIDEDILADIGESTDAAGKAALQALERACEDLKAGLIDAIITAPANNEIMQAHEPQFMGHVKYLESNFSEKEDTALMILVQDHLRVGLVTGRASLSELPQKLTKEKIVNAARTLHHSLRRDFKIQRPRIAVLALNPEKDNSFSPEKENELIKSATKELQEELILAFGPYLSDDLFGTPELFDFDGILAMYHDQGYAPFKTLSTTVGVNYTAGLPIIRTAPTHGVDYELAGKNQTSEDSLRHAIYLAVDIYRNRREYDEARKNPLRKLYTARGNDNEELTLRNDE